MAVVRCLCAIPVIAAAQAGLTLTRKAAASSRGSSNITHQQSLQLSYKTLNGTFRTGSTAPAVGPASGFGKLFSPFWANCEGRASTVPQSSGTEAGKMAGGEGADVMTEFMVDMMCDGCARAVRGGLEPLEGVKTIDIDVKKQLVRVYGTEPVNSMTTAMENVGRVVKLIGQGSSGDFQISAAVAEFKGPHVHGVVRIAQIAEQLARVEASFDGLSPGAHGWSINEYGDITRGAASTGGHYNPEGQTHGSPDSHERHAGDLGNLVADASGHADYFKLNDKIKVWDVIGRSVVVYEKPDDLGRGGKALSVVNGCVGEGVASAVVARSAGVGENLKQVCACDGTVIWEANNKL